MVARVTDSEVRSITGEPATVDPALAMLIATTLVDEQLATTTLTEATLKNIELLLAAHFLVLTTREGPLAAATLGEATERYHNIYAAGLSATRFGQQAILLDTTGKLATMADKAANTAKKDAQFEVI